MSQETVRRISTLGKLQAFLGSHSRIALFGAGMSGEFVRHYLDYLGVEPVCFADNNASRWGATHQGLGIWNPSRLPELGAGIIITTEQFAPAISEQLIGLGIPFQDILVIRQTDLGALFRDDADWPRYITEKYFVPHYRDYFKRMGIDCTGEVLTNGKIRFPNAFLEGLDYQVSFFSEICDYVLPILCDDFSMLAEGPAEHGFVTFPEGGTVIDAGANVGLFSIVAAARGAHVYAFEPIREVVKLLEKAAGLYPNIEIVPFALSESSAQAMIAISEGKNTCNSLVLPAGPRMLSIDTITIDDWVHRNGISKVDFIKADIEGAERLMLRGAKETLRNHAPSLSICTYHLPDDPEVLENLVLEANPSYVIEHHWLKLYAYVP